MIIVDNSFIPATVAGITSRWCHLMSDERDKTELHEFAARLGLKRSWFQHERKYPDSPWLWHYDVTEGKRRQAVRLGAVEVDWHDIRTIIAKQKEEK